MWIVSLLIRRTERVSYFLRVQKVPERLFVELVVTMDNLNLNAFAHFSQEFLGCRDDFCHGSILDGIVVHIRGDRIEESDDIRIGRLFRHMLYVDTPAMSWLIVHPIGVCCRGTVWTILSTKRT